MRDIPKRVCLRKNGLQIVADAPVSCRGQP